ncbi:enoyl-CoA hydratase/isomerase [Teredinibacter haidensis]|uniref:enoyl-CoA hydratase/isomerase n=1 Tax=Teredinibacter haidensis TaxID=2731755 RepID=UPI000948A49C|nr:enoyl-CoA hydratase/isomerase [Teredinibacter haidensis]
MGLVENIASYNTINVRIEEEICFLQIHRPESQNAINAELIEDMNSVLNTYSDQIKVVVLEGSPEVFCFGADFNELQQSFDTGNVAENQDPGPLYDLWHTLATGPFITVAHVQGKANAGGIGFVSACDIVLAQENTVFSLSELLFGLMPACVLPFLIRRIGHAKANYMTLITQPINAQQALEWGLVDAIEPNSENLLRKQLLRLRRLNKSGIQRYKNYMSELSDGLRNDKEKALAANKSVFSDADNLEKIARYVKTGQFPWE